MNHPLHNKIHSDKNCPVFNLLTKNRLKPYETKIFQSINNINKELWDQIIENKNIFLQRDYLKSVENGDCDDMTHYYAQFMDKGNPVGIAIFQVTYFRGKSIESLIEKKSRTLNFLGKTLDLIGKPLNIKLIVCGNSFTTGEDGFYFSPHAKKEIIMDSLANAVKQIQYAESSKGNLTGVIFKDFYKSLEPLVSNLEKYSYTNFEAEPNMILFLDKNWKSLEDYYSSLLSKYRVKAKRSFAKSSALVIKNLTCQDLEENQTRLKYLHDSVLNHSSYCLGSLNIPSMINLRKNHKDEFIIKGYYLKNKLIGFQTGFIQNNTIIAYQVGFDYSLNHEYSIYPRMLYDYLQIAIDNNLEKVNFGRTASEIKSTIGAVPVNTKCYLKHNKPVLNLFLLILSFYVSPSSFSQRKPFKKIWYEMNKRIIKT
jgi:predicted N-acyltransferase